MAQLTLLPGNLQTSGLKVSEEIAENICVAGKICIVLLSALQ